MTDDNNQAPQDGQAAVTPAPSKAEDGQAAKVPEDLPEKFQGKSAQDIAKSYLELEKKLGENAKEVELSRNEAKQVRSQIEILGKAIEGNPALLKAIETEIQRVASSNGQPASPNSNGKPDLSNRNATQGLVIENFEQKYGIDRLSEDKKKDLQEKIGAEIFELTGKAVGDLPVDLLPRYLDKGYKLATIGDEKEKARLGALLSAKQNDTAAFGSMQSSSVSSQTRELTPAQKMVARKLKISEENYLKQVEEIEKEQQ